MGDKTRGSLELVDQSAKPSQGAPDTSERLFQEREGEGWREGPTGVGVGWGGVEETASEECHLRLVSLWPASTHIGVDTNRH